LSKTTFNYGIQCPKSLYLHKHHKRLQVHKEPFTEHEQHLMNSGTEVGELARTLLPGGIDCSPTSHYNYTASILKTRKLTALRMPVLYEAAFEASGVMVAVDILSRRRVRTSQQQREEGAGGEGEWHMYEVKSSTRVKPEHLLDAALQSWVLQQSGLHVSSVSLVHLDREYVRQGALDVQQLFKVVDISREVEELLPSIAQQVGRLQDILEGPEEPAVVIGPHCSAPYSCKFKTHCFSAMTPPLPATCSVLDLKYGGGRKQWDLLRLGVTSTLQVPPEYPLSAAQRTQVTCDQSQRQEHCEVDKVEEFLTTLRYPLSYLVRGL
jgi:hypothetical protein